MNIPCNWSTCKLPLVAYFQEGPGLRKYQYRDKGIPFLNIRTLINESVDLSLCKFLDEDEVDQKYIHFLLNEGDLVCSTSGTLGKLATIKASDLPLMLNTSVVRFRTLDQAVMLQRFLRLYLKSEGFLSQARLASTGSAQVNIGPSHLATFDFSLPPLPEQKRIADKLDSVLARVDACRDRLDRLPALLKRFRQSILTAATSGRLTEDWREQNAIGNESWHYPMIGNLVAIKNGRAFPSADYADEGVRLIRPGNLHHSGSVQWSAKNTTHLPESYAREFPTFVLGKGELLMNLTAQSLKDDFLGRVCLKTDSVPALLNQRICAFYSKSSSDIRPYLFVYFRSPVFRSYVETLDSGTLIKHMHTKQLLSHVIPVPTENEQTEIVRRVEILFAFADRLDARLATARKQVGQLTPALLAKAFRGELVAQDPADEPAAELLKRLAAQREAAPKAKRGRARA
ncbi:MAG: type I restriction enzyme S subunit [Rhodocyclaceae bacterium]|nr:MAG: type I restriction enzyme S subunit [Rhodocyclaceae bacterium]